MTKDMTLYLEDIWESILRIESYIEGLTSDEFLANNLVRDAVERRLGIIGEAAKKVDHEIRERYPEIPWREMAGLRDVLTHGYNHVDPMRIWIIATTDVPVLKDGLRPVIEELGKGHW